MDDGEAVNPREAVAGLTLLGVTMAALVGTFVYRIVMENPTRPSPKVEAPAMVNAEASPSAFEPSVPEADSAAASPAQTPAAAAPIEAPAAAPPDSGATDANAATEAPPFKPESTPRFIAPASHPN